METDKERAVVRKSDERGVLEELFQIPGVGEFNYVTVKPAKSRGDHYHLRRIEQICALEGEGRLVMRDRNTHKIVEKPLHGDEPSVVSTKVNWTHKIENTGDSDLKLVVWSSEVFNPDDPDIYPEKV